MDFNLKLCRTLQSKTDQPLEIAIDFCFSKQQCYINKGAVINKLNKI